MARVPGLELLAINVLKVVFEKILRK